MTPADLPAAVDELRELLDRIESQRAALRTLRRLMPRPRSVPEMLARHRGGRLLCVVSLPLQTRKRLDLATLPHRAPAPERGR